MYKSSLLQLLFCISIIAMPLAGCQPVNQKPALAPFDAWNYSDVRLLDPIDAIVPNHELIALYTKNDTQYFQIRMDFLSLDSLVDQDIYIPINTNPGGVDQIILQTKGIISVDFNWDYLIIIPASGAIEVVNSQYSKLQNIELFLLLDQEQDKLVVSLLRNKISAISNLTEIQIFITEPEEKYVIDSTEPVSIDAISPSRAEISFVFWNTFHSATPAETLRSWAGAHSGLISSRHGIKYLLQAADASKYPIFLADFNNPKTMAAMDYLGVLPWIRNLMSNGIIISPHEINIYHKNHKLINDYFDNFEINKYDFGGNDYANKNIKIDKCIVLPTETIETITGTDLFLPCKVMLISGALSSLSNLTLIGGDFQASSLGNPLILSEFFSFIQNHPWIHVTPAPELKTYINDQFTNSDVHDANMILSQPELDLYSDLVSLPTNQISSLAYQVYMSLSNPNTSALIPLGKIYINHIGHIIEAAKWFDHPYSLTTCDIDIDYDGSSECILANNSLFLTIEPQGAYIPFIFFRDENGAHQIVGPSWELLIGISDPSMWNLTRGVMSDPGQILGAFSDQNFYNNRYNAQIHDGMITFENELSLISKTVFIDSKGIHVRVQQSGAATFFPKIPLIIDPWTMNTPGWGNNYKNIATSEGIKWVIKSDITVELLSMNQMHIYPFNATKEKMALPEDPNYDYGRGHYLPYPMALVEIQPNESYSVDIEINP